MYLFSSPLNVLCGILTPCTAVTVRIAHIATTLLTAHHLVIICAQTWFGVGQPRVVFGLAFVFFPHNIHNSDDFSYKFSQPCFIGTTTHSPRFENNSFFMFWTILRGWIILHKYHLHISTSLVCADQIKLQSMLMFSIETTYGTNMQK